MSKRAIKICIPILLVVLIFTVVTIILTKEKTLSLDEKLSAGADVYDEKSGVVLDSNDGKYSIKINTVYETTPETDSKDAPKAKTVVVIIYEYTNDDIESGLVISSAHFKAFDKSGNELQIYPQKNMFEPGEIGTLGTHTASVAFAFNSDTKYIEVDYYNDLSQTVPDFVYEGEWE